MSVVSRCVLVLLFLLAAPAAQAVTVVDVDFDLDEDGFLYLDDAFLSTHQPAYASGQRVDPGGFSGGGLQLLLGGIDGAQISGMSGGWQLTFNLTAPEPLEITFRYNATQTVDYDENDRTRVMLALNGFPVGTGNAFFVAEVEGVFEDAADRTTDWRLFRADLGTLLPGVYTITIGGYNNQKNSASELSTLLFDDVRVASPEPVVPNLSAQAIVDALDPVQFKQNIVDLVEFGTRFWDESGNAAAIEWLDDQLDAMGYVVQRHDFTYQGQPQQSIYATKIGDVSPDRMYIVSGHMDSYNTRSSSFAPGADDDASGTSLVLEAARAFAPAHVRTETSIRFVLWNNEETGLNGSEAYVNDRRALQGIESPAGSGNYPEPTWLGVIQHDMILFDHGMPPQPNQSPGADIDIEYQSGAGVLGGAIDLATAVFVGNVKHASIYPAEVSAEMNFTDSKSFQQDCPAVSVRENRREAEIGNGANPNWHEDTDVIAAYSPADFQFGFNVVQTTTGAVARLSGATVVICGDGIVPPAEGCDDGGTEIGDGCDDSCQVETDWSCAGEPSACAVCRTQGLGFLDPADDTRFVWDAPVGAVCPLAFDVIRGQLSMLLTGGDYSSTLCLADNVGTGEWSDAALPEAGDGFWYLTRIDGESWNAPGDNTAGRNAISSCP